MNNLPPDSGVISTGNGNPRGSLWNKWDLHVHTPASVVQHYGDNFREETWEEYISALESLPPEIKAIGINDYFFIDGYRRVVNAKRLGRLTNIDLILPVIELRIASFSGHKELRKINFHVIFSDELTADQIDTFFLRSLGLGFTLESGQPWHGVVCHRDGLTEFGRVIRESTPEPKRTAEPDLQVGFRNAAFPLEKIYNVLDQSIFHGKYLTAIGLNEWSDMRWDDGSGAVKRSNINEADLVFTAAHLASQCYERREQLRKQGVNSNLIDCSDAHFYASSCQPERLGNVFTWLKADLTFSGLQRVVQRFEERVFVGDVSASPPKQERVKRYKRRYIQSIEIRKKRDSELDEVWFDCEVPLNPDLVAIIGSQGNGKSALTDIIALCGNTKIDSSEFSFLTKDKFCDKQNKAGEFEATLTWEDGTKSKQFLDAIIDSNSVENVRYVPQRFFETITNETIVKEGGHFYGEIKKAIFSHIASSDQLGHSNFDQLIGQRTQGSQNGLQILRQQMGEINRNIVSLELACAPAEKTRVENEIAAKHAEIRAHESNKPQAVEESSGSNETSVKIEELREKEGELQRERSKAEAELNLCKQRREFLSQQKKTIENEQQRLKGFLDGLQREFVNNSFSFDIDQLMSVSVDTTPISTAMDQLTETAKNLENSLNPDMPDSLAEQLRAVRRQREALQNEMDEANTAYQTYRNQLREWENQLSVLQGDRNNKNSLKWLEGQLLDITTTRPRELDILRANRRTKAREIHEQLHKLAEIYRELTTPVQKHISANELTHEKYRIEFAIRLVEHDIVDKFFGVVGHSSGTFSGVQEGRGLLQSLADKRDFASADDTIEFVEDILDKLGRNHKIDPPATMELAKQIRKGYNRENIYNLLFGLEYLAPEYSLALNGKPLKQLSPGERGVLLLIFYLIVDQGEEPLIIDQPEGNLNNQSIFDNLVPVFKEAKERRQIIVVTHNPNLAVVCDAEQIIHAKIDFQDRNRVSFDSGSLENPKFNRLALDVLEGTPPAFDARRQTYQEYWRGHN